MSHCRKLLRHLIRGSEDHEKAVENAPTGSWLVPLTLVRLTRMDCVKLASVKGVKAAVSAVLACASHAGLSMQFNTVNGMM